MSDATSRPLDPSSAPARGSEAAAGSSYPSSRAWPRELPLAARAKVGILDIRTDGARLRVNGAQRALRDGELLDIDGHACVVSVRSSSSLSLAGARLEVTLLSRDRVDVQVVHGAHRHAFRAVRLAELVAELCGRRVRDQRRGEKSDDQGWVDKRRLATALDIDLQYLNVLISRLRRKFQKLGFIDHRGVIESRASDCWPNNSAGEVRLGLPRVVLN